MNRFIKATLFIGVAFLFSRSAKGQVVDVFKGVTANTDTTTATGLPADFVGGWISCAQYCDARIWSDTGSSTATVNFYSRADSTDSEPTNYLAGQVVNPGSPGSYVTLPHTRQYRITVEGYAAGSIHVKFIKSSIP